MVHITIVTGFSSRAVEMELKSHTEAGLPCTGFTNIMSERGRDSFIDYMPFDLWLLRGMGEREGQYVCSYQYAAKLRQNNMYSTTDSP